LRRYDLGDDVGLADARSHLGGCFLGDDLCRIHVEQVRPRSVEILYTNSLPLAASYSSCSLAAP